MLPLIIGGALALAGGTAAAVRSPIIHRAAHGYYHLPTTRQHPVLCAPSKRPRKVLNSLPFEEAREMARSMGLTSYEEWSEYACPGTYRLPRNPDEVWADEWLGWDDWLGVPLSFEEAQAAVRSAGLRSEADYRAFKQARSVPPKTLSDAPWTDHAQAAKAVAASFANVPQRTRTDGKPTSDVAARLPAMPDKYYKDAWAGWAAFLAQ